MQNCLWWLQEIDEVTDDGKEVSYKQESIFGDMEKILEAGAKALYGQKVNRSHINNIASKFINPYGSLYSVKELGDNFENVFAYIQENKTIVPLMITMSLMLQMDRQRNVQTSKSIRRMELMHRFYTSNLVAL
ncbi:MAG: hypothetical protein Q4B73_09905 [Lachnospiraceae bacterium]|nr:hypothetical protein [Lachnospiraceae bacterium]